MSDIDNSADLPAEQPSPSFQEAFPGLAAQSEQLSSIDVLNGVARATAEARQALLSQQPASEK